jgi:uncharacterized membrane protein
MSEVESKVKDAAEDTAEKVEGMAEKVKNGDGGSGIAKKLVTPAAVGLGSLAAGYAIRKGPDLIKDKVMPRLENKGEEEAEELGRSAVEGAKEKIGSGGGLMGKAAGMLGSDGDNDAQQAEGWGRGRRLPIQASIDVAVPPSVAFRAWDDFENLPEFMHRVESVEQDDDNTIKWTENIWGVSRTWKAEITERKPNQVIAWRSQSRGGHAGVVTFHKLSDRLTRVELNIDFQPEGLLEKMSSGLQFHRRAVKTDLKRFKAYVEMTENADSDKVGEEEREQPTSESSSQETQAKDDEQAGGDDSEERQKRQERREQRRGSSS